MAMVQLPDAPENESRPPESIKHMFPQRKTAKARDFPGSQKHPPSPQPGKKIANSSTYKPVASEQVREKARRSNLYIRNNLQTSNQQGREQVRRPNWYIKNNLQTSRQQVTEKSPEGAEKSPTSYHNYKAVTEMPTRY